MTTRPDTFDTDAAAEVLADWRLRVDFAKAQLARAEEQVAHHRSHAADIEAQAERVKRKIAFEELMAASAAVEADTTPDTDDELADLDRTINALEASLDAARDRRAALIKHAANEAPTVFGTDIPLPAWATETGPTPRPAK